MRKGDADVLYIVMPAYNEEENIESVVKQWYPVVEKIGLRSKLLIVNDGSKDQTYEKLLALTGKYPQLQAMDKPNSGHGSTCLFAYNISMEAGADYIFQTDSDGQTNPDEFDLFWNNRNEYDFIIGDRNSRQDGKDRVFVTKVLRMLVRVIFNVYVKDSNTPFRLMKADRLKKIMEIIPNDFFLCNVVISAIAVKWKERIIWYPITFKPRQGGVNSINFKRIIKIGWKAIGDFGKINKRLRNCFEPKVSVS